MAEDLDCTWDLVENTDTDSGLNPSTSMSALLRSLCTSSGDAKSSSTRNPG